MGDEAPPAPEFAQAPDLTADLAAPVSRAPADAALLPDYRIVMFYGHPHDPAMGVVGEHEIEQLAEILRQEAANYADPSRPVIPALEVIATVAQRVPGSDGTYILDTDTETLTTYIDFATEQEWWWSSIYKSDGAQLPPRSRRCVSYCHARTSIWRSIRSSRWRKGRFRVSTSARSARKITYAQKVLAEISATHGIPPKVLIVHQFREDMIQGKEQLAPIPGVQLVIDADGYGAPS